MQSRTQVSKIYKFQRLSEREGADYNNEAWEKQECGLNIGTEKQKQQWWQQPEELQDNRPAKDQRGDVKAGVDDQVEDAQRAAIQSLGRNRTAGALRIVHAYFQTHSPKGCGVSAGWGCHPNPTAVPKGLDDVKDKHREKTLLTINKISGQQSHCWAGTLTSTQLPKGSTDFIAHVQHGA